MTIYAGTSAFFANRTGPHNWLDNTKRPFLSLITTTKDGTKSYTDLFINNDKSVSVNVNKDEVTITFPVDTNQPIFRMLAKQEATA